MTESTPIDPLRKAFAEALGRAVAESVWREITGAQNSPKNTTARRTGKSKRARGLEKKDERTQSQLTA